MKLKQLLNEETRKILSEESINAIEKALTEKIDVAVKAALVEQDEEYADKLKKLLEAIDLDATTKLKRVVTVIDANNTKKLKQVVEHYNRVINKDARKFKKVLLESLSNYMDVYLEKVTPIDDIKQAVNNKTATAVLTNLRKMLSVDSALMKESVKGAVVEGKKQIDKLQSEIQKLKRNNRILNEKVNATKVKLFLEERTKGLPKSRRIKLIKTLQDKPLEYIKENFDYTNDLLEKNETKRNRRLQKEAFKNRVIHSDTPRKVLNENIMPASNDKRPTNAYVEGLKKFK